MLKLICSFFCLYNVQYQQTLSYNSTYLLIQYSDTSKNSLTTISTEISTCSYSYTSSLNTPDLPLSYLPPFSDTLTLCPPTSYGVVLFHLQHLLHSCTSSLSSHPLLISPSDQIILYHILPSPILHISSVLPY